MYGCNSTSAIRVECIVLSVSRFKHHSLRRITIQYGVHGLVVLMRLYESSRLMDIYRVVLYFGTVIKSTDSACCVLDISPGRATYIPRNPWRVGLIGASHALAH